MATSETNMNNNWENVREGEDSWENHVVARESISPEVGRGEGKKSAMSSGLEGEDQAYEGAMTSTDINMEQAQEGKRKRGEADHCKGQEGEPKEDMGGTESGRG